jgi:pimeloyl-ACP methyl ester carboxylesterase
MTGSDFLVRRITTQDGLSLYVRDYPGPADSTLTPLLCLGGLIRNSRDFSGIGKFHGRTRRVLVPDIRGRGKSDFDPEWQNYRPETYVGDVRHILCALGVHRVVVIGTSMGGIMGMIMAAAMPGALKALVLNDIGPIVRRRDLDSVITYMQNPPSLPGWPAAARHLRDAFGDDIPLTEEADWIRAAKNGYTEREDGSIGFAWDPNIIRPILADPTEVHDLWHLFRATGRIPVLTLRGARSNILDEAQLAEMSTLHKNMQSVVVPGVGHAPSLAEPISMETLNGFLTRV